MNVIFRVRLVELVGTTILLEMISKAKHVKESSKNAKQKNIILKTRIYIVPFEHLN